jgi:hypothetical protein
MLDARTWRVPQPCACTTRRTKWVRDHQRCAPAHIQSAGALRHIPGVAVLDLARRVRKRVPDRRAFAVLVPRTLNEDLLAMIHLQERMTLRTVADKARKSFSTEGLRMRS